MRAVFCRRRRVMAGVFHHRVLHDPPLLAFPSIADQSCGPVHGAYVRLVEKLQMGELDLMLVEALGERRANPRRISNRTRTAGKRRWSYQRVVRDEKRRG
jgi:hypothetical protein